MYFYTIAISSNLKELAWAGSVFTNPDYALPKCNCRLSQGIDACYQCDNALC